MYTKFLILTAGLAALTACPDGTSESCDSGANCEEDSGDTSTGDDLLITYIEDTCSNDTWHLYTEANGATTDGVINMTQNTQDPWQESHDILSVDFSNGTDYLERTLSTVDTTGEQQANVNSLFQCNMEPEMMFKSTIFDLDGNAADCVVWSGPNGDVSFFGGSCDNANNW